ncbi:MAG: transglycosylase SLT domain-containing protein [Candidatus Uhrbacteria bacterium]|nr:transglycosylase SLT domain-containing protein [Candidatus Uhrbacteria bacterium]
MNKNRFLPRIVAGLLAVGGIAALVEREPVKPVAEKPISKPEKPIEKKELGPESDPKFCAEHPIEAELRSHKVPLDKMQAALESAAELIRSHRYGDAKNEEKYFGACRDTERWASIQKSIHYASEKTGVPERVLIAMGLIESQFKEEAERSDTSVYGPYQMTLETAQEAAKDAKACFEFPIEVNTSDDLKETKIAVRLAALRLHALEKQYGQLGLAIIDYAGGRVGLEQKIKEAFPKIDLGEKDWTDMQRHHAAELQAQKQRDAILKRMKGGRVTDVDRQALRRAIGAFEAAGMAYTKAKVSWKQKRADLPKVLSDAGVTALALYEHEKAKGGEVPHSITYPFALDAIAERAEHHAKQIEAAAE